MLIVKKIQWDAIHGALVLALLGHVLALFAWMVFSSGPEDKPKLRVVARVDVIDRLEKPPPPPEAKKPAFKPPPVPVPKTAVPAPASPRPSVRPGGGSPPPGRSGAPARLEPELPKSTVPGGPGYPVGRGSGRGSKHGTGSGSGNGQGTGTGMGTGDGSGDGSGGGEPPPPPPPPPLGYVTFEATDRGIQPTTFAGTEGMFSFSFRNNCKEVLSLKVEGQGGDLYGSQFTGVEPGGIKTYELPLKEGWYTITISEHHFQDGWVARLRIDPR